MKEKNKKERALKIERYIPTKCLPYMVYNLEEKIIYQIDVILKEIIGQVPELKTRIYEFYCK